MMFSSFGTIRSHVKSMELQVKWQQKQKNPGMAEVPQSTAGTSTPNGKYNAFALEQKLKTGQKLSSEEIQYLRNNHPDLYSQAIDSERERQSYKSQLNGCNTKEDVMRANMHRVAALHDELTSVQNNPNLSQGEKFKLSVGIHMKAQAVSDEHAEFQRSSEYQKLPTEQELIEESKEAEKQKETEHAKTKEAERQEEMSDVDDHVSETPESQTIDCETGGIENLPVLKSETPLPAPDAAESRTAPEPVTPQTSYTYTSKGYATQSIPHGYANQSNPARGGMDVGV